MRFAHVSPKAVYVGIVLALPFVVGNFIAVTGIMPAYAWLVGLGPQIIFAIIALGFLGGVAALIPLFKKSTDGARRFFILNAIIGIGLIAFFTLIGYSLGEEIYRCDILKIPNCD